MKGTVLYGPRDVRFEERDEPKMIEPTDAIIRISAQPAFAGPTCGLTVALAGSPSRARWGTNTAALLRSAVSSVKPGQFVIGSFATSDNTCPHCRAGYQSSCHPPRVHYSGAGAAAARAAGRRDTRPDLGHALGRPDPEPADDLRCVWHRLVRRRCGQCPARYDGRGRR